MDSNFETLRFQIGTIEKFSDTTIMNLNSWYRKLRYARENTTEFMLHVLLPDKVLQPYSTLTNNDE